MPALPAFPPPVSPAVAVDAVWPPVADQFAVRLIGLTERLLPIVTDLERANVDDATMQRYYQIDHIGAQARRLARDLRILAGVSEGEIWGEDASLLEVLRWAASSVEQYTRVEISPGPEFAVAAHASDDVASLLAALLENATRFSPSTVRVSAQLGYDHSVTVRIDDDGIRFSSADLAGLNWALSGPVPPLDERTGKHTGFPVMHRVARKYGIRIELYDREPWGESTPAGTVAIATIPPHLLRRPPATVPVRAHLPQTAAVPPGPTYEHRTGRQSAARRRPRQAGPQAVCPSAYPAA